MARCRCSGSDLLLVNPAVESRFQAIEAQIAGMQAQDAAAWVPFTPTISFTSGVYAAAYKKVGSICHYNGVFTGALGNDGVTQGADLSLPFPAIHWNTTGVFGQAIYVNTGLNYYAGFMICQQASTARLHSVPGTVGGAFSYIAAGATQPFTWGAGDRMIWNLTYEVTG